MNTGLQSRQRGQVLILLFLGGLFLGGSAAGLSLLRDGKPVYELQKEVKALVPQEDRRKRIDAVLDQWKNEAHAFERRHSTLEKSLFGLMERQDTSRADFDELMAQADAVNARARQALLKLRFALREQVSDEEWRALFAPPAATR